MRAAVRAILDESDLDPEKVNVHEQPYGIGAEIIPKTWTPDHLGKRIVEAFVTLDRLPGLRGPKKPGNSWPQHIYEWADKLAQEEISVQEKSRRRRAQNAVRINPTAEDLRRMDVVLGWLSDFTRADYHECRIVQRWARLRSIPGRTVRGECERVGLNHMAFYRARDRALAALAIRIAAATVW